MFGWTLLYIAVGNMKDGDERCLDTSGGGLGFGSLGSSDSGMKLVTACDVSTIFVADPFRARRS